MEVTGHWLHCLDVQAGKLRHMSSFPPGYLPPLPGKGFGDRRAYLGGRGAPLPSSLHPEPALGLQAWALVPSPLLGVPPRFKSQPGQGRSPQESWVSPHPLCPAGTQSRRNEQLILTMKRGGNTHFSFFFTSITEQLKILEAVSL